MNQVSTRAVRGSQSAAQNARHKSTLTSSEHNEPTGACSLMQSRQAGLTGLLMASKVDPRVGLAVRSVGLDLVPAREEGASICRI